MEEETCLWIPLRTVYMNEQFNVFSYSERLSKRLSERFSSEAYNCKTGWHPWQENGVTKLTGNFQRQVRGNSIQFCKSKQTKTWVLILIFFFVNIDYSVNPI